jgi:hypothetical protein
MAILGKLCVILVIAAVIVVPSLPTKGLATEVKSTGDRLGILVLSPEDYSTVYLKPGDPLTFRVAIPADVEVKKVTLFLCGKTYTMKYAGTWGNGMIIYEASILLPPINDLYSWKILVETSLGSVESCTHKTMVIFLADNKQQSIQQDLRKIEYDTQTLSACPLVVNKTKDLVETREQQDSNDIGKFSPLLLAIIGIGTASLVGVVFLRKI